MLRQLLALHDAKSLSPMEFKGRLLELIEHLSQKNEEHWENFIKLWARHDLEAESLRALGIPDAFSVDDVTLTCAVSWFEEDREPGGTHWSQAHIPLPDDPQGREFPVTPAYRPIVRDRLPEGSRVFEVTDARHAALLCIVDVLRAMIGDIKHVAAEAPHRQAWKWVWKMAALYREQAELSQAGLRADDYKDWRPILPSFIPLLQASKVIGEKAGNSRTVRMLSLHATMACLEDAIDRAQSEPYTTKEGDRLDQILSELVVLEDKLSTELGFHNDTLISEADDPPPPGSQLILVARPIPVGLPAIVLIPADHGNVVRPFSPG